MSFVYGLPDCLHSVCPGWLGRAVDTVDFVHHPMLNDIYEGCTDAWVDDGGGMPLQPRWRMALKLPNVD